MDGLSYLDYARMAALPLDVLARECDMSAFHGHGPGGQGVNTADSAVRMTHRPTGIVVVSRTSRSQFRNRQLCLQRLRAELHRRAQCPAIRQATSPTKASERKRLDGKRHRSQVKKFRRSVREDEE